LALLVETTVAVADQASQAGQGSPHVPSLVIFPSGLDLGSSRQNDYRSSCGHASDCCSVMKDSILQYGAWIVFALVFLDSIGLPLPGEAILVSAAIFAETTQELSIASFFSPPC
jgi:hypothetical protein